MFDKRLSSYGYQKSPSLKVLRCHFNQSEHTLHEGGVEMFGDPLVTVANQSTPSMKEVSRCSTSVLTNSISFRVFSKTVLVLATSRRSTFGAITIDKLWESIFVRAAFSGAAKTLKTSNLRIEVDSLVKFEN